MLNEKEINFLQFVNNSNNGYVRKFDVLLKTSVLSQLSRNMLTELFENYRDNIDNKMNVKAICMQCHNSLFNVVKNIAKKYFELVKQFDIEMKQQAIHAEEDRIEEQRLSELLNNDENKIVENKLKNESILLENLIVTPTVSEPIEVATEEKKEKFIKPVVHNKVNNTTPLLNKNKKKN